MRLVVGLAAAGAGALLWSSSAGADALEEGVGSLGPLGSITGETISVVEELLPPAPPEGGERRSPIGGLADGVGQLAERVQSSEALESVLSELPPIAGLPQLPAPPDGSGLVPTLPSETPERTPLVDQGLAPRPSPSVAPGPGVPPSAEDVGLAVPGSESLRLSGSESGSGSGGAAISKATQPPAAPASGPSQPGGGPSNVSGPSNAAPVPSSSSLVSGPDLLVGVVALATFALALLASRFFAEQVPGRRHPVFAIDTPPG